jgi:hypothetical protein
VIISALLTSRLCQAPSQGLLQSSGLLVHQTRENVLSLPFCFLFLDAC